MSNRVRRVRVQNGLHARCHAGDHGIPVSSATRGVAEAALAVADDRERVLAISPTLLRLTCSLLPVAGSMLPRERGARMRVVLIGADFEENLGLAMIASVLAAEQHEVIVLPFNRTGDAPQVAAEVARSAPAMVGLSMQFQHRAHDFLSLARRLRAEGYRGHITCGGQFPTMAWNEVLGNRWGIDSVVLFEGEHTVVELARAVATCSPICEIPGLACLDSNRRPRKTAPRSLEQDFDRLPLPLRYREPARHAGVPFIPVMASRGCWGACSYCSITTFYREARACAPTRTLRMRTPENVAAEMAVLAHRAGGQAIFCFHDDNFLLPRPADSIERVRAIRRGLDEYGVGRVGFIGKCRPETLNSELAIALRDLGVIRLYVGVENTSAAGAAHLNRSKQHPFIRQALKATRDAGIFACYNLLLFEPETTLGDVRENIAFMREHASHPVNFCRAEPYYGTPLHRVLETSGNLSGSYLGWDYRLRDDRSELLFRICSAAFRERNFSPTGVGNRYMGLGYTAKLIEHFYPERAGRRAEMLRRADEITRGISSESADLLEEALRLAEGVDLADRDRIERETALLGLKISAMDRVWHVALDDLFESMSSYARECATPAKPRNANRSLQRVLQSVALAGLVVGVAGCGGEAESGKQVSDPVPPDAGLDAKGDVADAEPDWMVADPAPEDAGVEADVMVADPPPPDAGYDMWADPIPPDASYDASSDPLPADAGYDNWADPPPPDYPMQSMPSDQWQDTSPKRSVRTQDLPLYEPPQISLRSVREGDRVRVKLEGGPESISLRWQSEGQVEGDDREVLWTPAHAEDQLRVAVRSKGGASVVSVRAGEVK